MSIGPAFVYVAEHFRKDRLAQELGIEIVTIQDGFAEVRMALTNEHKNSIGTAHGGAIFTLGDYAMAIAGNSHGVIAVLISASISCVKAATGGVLTARAREVARSRRIGNLSIEISDEAGDIVATMQGIVYFRKELVPGAPDGSA